MSTEPLRACLAAVLFAALLSAQARAPFTGTLRDLDGKALGGAEVTCVFVPDQLAPGTFDRASAQTDAAGHFHMQLLVGCPYVVWAIGPAGEHGARSAMWPRPDGAGGRNVELIADERREPAKLKVTGTLPWMNDGPLSLRFYVASACPLGGKDFVIPGDGIVSLPPVPSPLLTVGMIDGRGQPIQFPRCDLDGAPEVAFSAPQEIAVIARDDHGALLAGVQIVQLMTAGRVPGRMRYQTAAPVIERALAVTGPDGKAVGRTAGCDLLCGRMRGRSDCWSGWFQRVRIRDAMEVGDEGPVEFVLPVAQTRTFQMTGLGPGERAAAWFYGLIPFHISQNIGDYRYQYVLPPATAAAADGARDGAEVRVRPWLVSDSPVPQRIVGDLTGSAACVAELDLAHWRRFAIAVADDQGRPVAGADVVVSASHQINWQERCVTNVEGRADLWVSDQADWLVHADTGKAVATKLIAKAAAAGSLALKLEPLPVMRLRIVDGEGHPVRGASLDRPTVRFAPGVKRLGGVFRREGGDPMVDMVSVAVNESSCAWARSNGTGVIELPCMEVQGIETRFHVLAGRLKSGEVDLKPGPYPVGIEMK